MTISLFESRFVFCLILFIDFSSLIAAPKSVNPNKQAQTIGSNCLLKKLCREDCLDKSENYKNIARPIGILAWGLSAPFQDQSPLLSNFYEECTRDCERSVICDGK
jgi:hypothetical protein